MTEDPYFNAQLKTALEDSPGLSPAELRRIEAMASRRRPARWCVASLMAASVAAVLAFYPVISAHFHFGSSGDSQLNDIIELLAACDDISLDDAVASTGDLLLAWQEAPIAN